MTKSPRPNVTRNLSHARGPARPVAIKIFKPEARPARRIKARARPESERASGLRPLIASNRLLYRNY